MSDSSRAEAAASLDERPALRWPPPALERMQGDLWRIAASAALAGALMVAPILLVAAREEPFATLGPLADAWWVTPLLATAGLGFALDALIRAARLLRRASRSVAGGYDWTTVAYVVSDSRRDMGFLLQGARHFSVMEPDERRAVALMRVLWLSLFSVGGLWLSVALSAGLLLAARGWIQPSALWKVTLLPSAGLFAVGAVLGIVEDTRVRAARRAWHGHEWAEDLVATEIREWRSRFGGDPAHADEEIEGGRHAPAAARASIVMVVLAVVVAYPVVTLLPSTTIGPLLAVVAAPGLGTVQRRSAMAEAYRPYRVTPDPEITSGEAGRLLQNLLYVGWSGPAPPGEQEPPLRIVEPWMPADPPPGDMAATPRRWTTELFPVVRSGSEGALRDYLAKVAAHPAQVDFSRLARAPRLDAAAARWQDPFPPDVTLASIPVPRFGEFRTAAYAHIGAAAHQLALGRPQRAEEMVREVISVGFLLGDQGPTVIENVIGYFMVQEGAKALESLYRVTGRDAEVERLDLLRSVADHASSRIHLAEVEGPESFVRSIPSLVTDSATSRGLRWEEFTLMTTLSPCLNMRRIVFGPSEDYRAFVDRAHAALVEWPSEEGYFELAKGGLLDATADAPGTPLGRLFTLSMRPGEAACGQVVRRLRTLQEMF